MVKLDLFGDPQDGSLYRLEGRQEAQLDYAAYRPTLHDVSRLFDNYHNVVKGTRRNLVGERESALTTFCAFVMRRRSVYIRSYAGSGKTEIAEAVVSSVPRYKLYLIDNSSPKAIWYEESAINASEYCYIGELQKVQEDTVEALKSWMEGRAATRTVPDMVRSSEEGRPVSRTVHLDVRPVLVTQAYENKASKDVNDEFLRRVYDLRTDPSIAQTRRVKMSKLGRRANPWKKHGLSEEDAGLLQQHIGAAIDLPIEGYALPGIDAEGGFETYVPEEYVIARSYADHFLDLAEGIARFYYYDRIVHDKHLLVTPADVWASILLNGQQLRLACFRLDAEDTALLQQLPPIPRKPDGGFAPTNREKLTESQVMAGLSSMGLNLEKGKVRERLVKLSTMTPYVDVDRDVPPHRYYRSPGVEAGFDMKVDWNRVVDDMAQGARDVLPQDVAEEYVTRFCGKHARAVSPTAGTVVYLRSLTTPKEDAEDDAPARPIIWSRPPGLLDFGEGSRP